MTVLPIRQIGDPVLRTPASAVGEIDDRITALIADMQDTNDDAGGIGIAAPQVGVGLRIFAWAVEDSRGVVINPTLQLSGEPSFLPRPSDADPDAALEEGCLSVRGHTADGAGVHGPVARYPEAVLTGVDPEGHQLRVQADGLLATCFQHEVDHLDGTLFLDRLSGEYRKKAMRALRSLEPAA